MTKRSAIDRILEVYRFNQSALARDLKTTRFTVNQWVRTGIIPARWILVAVSTSKKRDGSESKSVLPGSDFLIKLMLKEHGDPTQRVKKMKKNQN